MLGELSLKRLRDGLSGLDQPIQMRLHPADGKGQANAKMAAVARSYEVAAGGGLVVRPGDGVDLPALPALTVSWGQRSNIRYLALPEGHEVAPFVDGLVGLAKGRAPEARWAERLDQLDQPVDVLVFIAAACPHCPQAVRAAIQLALASARVTVTVVDAQLFEDLAERFRVRSVPTTVIDTDLALVGVKPPAELAARVLSRGDEQSRFAVFQSLVESGRFEDAAERVLDGAQKGYFFNAWKQSTTQERLGLMLLVERILARERGGLDVVVLDLLQLLQVEDAALRGDTADLLGQIGHIDAASSLERLLGDPNPDVAEIAEEALDGIHRRNQT